MRRLAAGLRDGSCGQQRDVPRATRAALDDDFRCEDVERHLHRRGTPRHRSVVMPRAALSIVAIRARRFVIDGVRADQRVEESRSVSAACGIIERTRGDGERR